MKELEKASKKFGDIYYGEYTDITSHMAYAFTKGAKWQAERSYTKEEVLEIVRKSRYAEFEIDDLEKWFSKFKKNTL